MENCMSDKLELSAWGLTLNAQGSLAIGAAVIIVLLLLIFYQLSRSG
jgi:hypothetical protein